MADQIVEMLKSRKTALKAEKAGHERLEAGSRPL